ncbi:MAG TPA: amidohydrolase family protein [Xanthobacteraceae bacterium]|nr:amidohydrolase family protein [Xanthobacteraceae bacterium]
MRGIGPLNLLIGVSLAFVIGTSTDSYAQTTALRGARVIDGRGGAPIDNAVIVVRDGRIVAIGPSAATAVPPDAQVVDYTGKAIIPGLVSDHSHIGIFIGLKAAPENYNRDAILRQLKQLEAYGITTVMALGLNGPLFYELRPELHAGRVPGADLFGADQGLGVPGGQPSATAVPIGENRVSRPDTVEMARASIREMAARKTDMVKIWLDGAGGLMPKLKPDIYSAVIDEAHKSGLRVAAHIYDLDDAKAIVRAGVDIIAHGVRDKPVDSEFIDMMKARSVWYISTIVLDYTNYIFADQPPWMSEPFLQRALHPAVRAQFDDPEYRERMLASPATAKNRAAVATNKQNLKAVSDAGIGIGFGSDSGVGLRIPGVAEHLELALMVEAGLTPMQAITNATSNAAALLKLDDRGVLAPGKLADLVVLEGDPTADISNSRKIHAVWHRGKKAAGPVATFTP